MDKYTLYKKATVNGAEVNFRLEKFDSEDEIEYDFYIGDECVANATKEKGIGFPYHLYYDGVNVGGEKMNVSTVMHDINKVDGLLGTVAHIYLFGKMPD